MPEEIEIQPEEIIEELSKAGFLKKLKPHKFKILGGVLGVFVFTGALFGAYKIVQRQGQPALQPTPVVILTPTPDPTADWRTYQLMGANKEPLNITYRLPKDVGEPVCANAGCYYQETLLPGFSTLAIIPVGEGQGYQHDWEELIEQVIDNNNFSQKISTISDLPTVEFSGELSAPTSSDLLLLSESYGRFRGYLVQVNEQLSLEILHYQDRFVEEEIDFLADESIFNLIISTFRFLEEESCVGMSLSEAKEIALESECVEEGSLTEEYFCNENTGTWWLDLEIEKPGCAPACVIDVSTGEAEINWRCTGLISSGERVFCEEPRPQFCTMECIINPPYICGSDGKSYCSKCQACAKPDINWYVIQDELCEAE